MHRLHHGTLRISTPCRITALLALGLGMLCGSTASAQKLSHSISTAVIPFADLSGRDSQFIADKATDAVALALDDSQEYTVMTRADTKRELEGLGVLRQESPRFSISIEQMVRLGQRLKVDKITTGSVDLISVERSGRCRCVLTVRLLDVSTQEYLDGATADYTTRSIPGWKGDEAEIINEALRSAAEDCLRKILTSRRPRGNVDMVDQSGEIIVNLGYRDGIEVGMELLVVRGIWNAAQERVDMRKVGIVEVKEVELNICRCTLTSGSLPRTSDKAYVMYRPSTKIAEAARAERASNYLTYLAGIGLLFGIYRTALGPDVQSPPGAQAFLTQASPGAEPRISVNSTNVGVGGSAKTHGWLVYRGQSLGFPATADDQNFLISALEGGNLSNYEDEPPLAVGLTYALTFQYLDETGTQKDATATITYNHLAMTAGQTYYYKLRRLVDPGIVQVPITGGGTTTGQVAPLVPVAVTFTITPQTILSEASNAAGPVTFFFPATLQTPSDGNASVDWSANSTVFTWTPTLGADQYRVIIYTNPQATGDPVKMSEVLNFTGSGSTMNWRLNSRLDASTTYYWFVASWKSAEAAPRIQSNNASGYLLSSPFKFTTVSSPPGTPGTSAFSVGSGRPAPRTGIWKSRVHK